MFKKLFQKLRRKNKTLFWCDDCSEWIIPKTKNYGIGEYKVKNKTYYDISIVFLCPLCETILEPDTPTKTKDQ